METKEKASGTSVECTPKRCFQGGCGLFPTCDLKDSPQVRQEKMAKIQAAKAKLEAEERVLKAQGVTAPKEETRGGIPEIPIPAPKKQGRPKNWYNR